MSKQIFLIFFQFAYTPKNEICIGRNHVGSYLYFLFVWYCTTGLSLR
nr:MAG TPA: hypothetical protein [Caudoviricetes sp.]